MNKLELEYSPILEHYNDLIKYCRYLSKNTWDGDDLAQEAILKAINHYADQGHIPKSLLTKMAYNQWIDWTRKRRFEVNDSDIIEEKEQQVSSASQLAETLELLLHQLTPKQSVIFILKEVFLYQVKEIALMMVTTETAVKASLHRTKKRIADMNEEAADFEQGDEEDRSNLLELLQYAIEQQDPTILIQHIPSIPSLATEANVVRFTCKPSKISTSPTLSMVA
ncbi:sigma-70 family RNA polymerase sigma factor [Bacillus massiliigorillae]|uniref:sigma-70 family RNA polymerase sigma factor n=1 Tax=Bacillus massiliigorillae TaxID=1243664 RepID=UPI0003A26923|nr:sigma-70 family RNA polymerase sigma factor [Bacillus massiliigorillae]